jgi:hypothetical protein
MKVYQFRIVGVSLALAIISLIIPFPFVAAILTTISFVMTCIWWCSNYPGVLLKDISGVLGRDVGIIMLVSTMIGTMVVSIFSLTESTKPFLIRFMNVGIWNNYYWYFFVMYIFPATLAICFLVRVISSLKKLQNSKA